MRVRHCYSSPTTKKYTKGTDELVYFIRFIFSSSMNNLGNREEETSHQELILRYKPTSKNQWGKFANEQAHPPLELNLLRKTFYTIQMTRK